MTKDLFKISIKNNANVEISIQIENQDEYDALSDCFQRLIEGFVKHYEENDAVNQNNEIEVHPAFAVVEAMVTVLAENKDFEKHFNRLVGLYRERLNQNRPSDAMSEGSPSRDTDPLVIPLSIKSSGPKS